MNTTIFGKWLFALCCLAYLLVYLWGCNPAWNYLTSGAAGVGVTMINEFGRFFSKKSLILWGFWAAYTAVVVLCFR